MEQAQAQTAQQVRDFEEQLKEVNDLLKTAQDNEIELRKKQRELERQRKEQALELERKLDEQTGKIKQELN